MYQFSWYDLTPYMLVLAVLSLVMKGKGTVKNKARICFWLMFIFSAIRYGIGYDYYAYMKSALHQVQDYALERFEPLSRLLVDIGYHTHYQVFFIISSFLILYPVYKCCIKLSINPVYSLVIFFMFPMFYLEGLSIVRNAIAYSFILYAYLLLTQKRLILSVLFVVMSVMFHKSALIGVLIYPLYYVQLNKKIHLILFVCSFLVSNLAQRVLSDYASIIPFLSSVEGYLEFGRQEGGTMTLIVNFLTIFHFFIWDKMVKFNSDNLKKLCCFNVGACLWNIMLPIDSTLALRLSTFFLMFLIFIVPQYKYIFSVRYRKLVGLMSYSFFVVLFLSYFLINISAYLKVPERMSNLPYQTIFFHKDYSNYLY